MHLCLCTSVHRIRSCLWKIIDMTIGYFVMQGKTYFYLSCGNRGGAGCWFWLFLLRQAKGYWIDWGMGRNRKENALAFSNIVRVVLFLMVRGLFRADRGPCRELWKQRHCTLLGYYFALALQEELTPLETGTWLSVAAQMSHDLLNFQGPSLGVFQCFQCFQCLCLPDPAAKNHFWEQTTGTA